MPNTSDKQITMAAGEYLIAAELSRQGYKATIMSGQTPPSVDIAARDPETQQEFTVQVQTVRYRKGWSFYIDEKAGSYSGFMALVVLDEPSALPFTTYLLTTTEAVSISDKAREVYLKEHPDVKPVQPLLLREENIAQFLNNWQRLTDLIRETGGKSTVA